MSTQSEIDVRLIGDDEKPLFVDPTTVGCGFLLFPKEMARVLQEAHVHQALQTNKTELWTAVRRHNPSVPVHLITATKDLAPGDAVAALNHVGKYPGYTIALDTMQMSPDGGKTFVQVYAGLSWKPISAGGRQEVFVAGPQKLLPGKPAPSLSEPARILDTFIAPSKTFTDLRYNASWWAPWLIIAVVWVAFVYTVDKKIGFRKVTEDSIQMVPKAADQFEKLPPEQREQQIEARTKGTRYFDYAKSVLRLAWFALIAGVLLATFKFGAGADVSFKRSFAVVTYASLPMAIQLLLGIVSLLAGVSPEGYTPDNPVASNPAYFMNPADSLVRYSLAAPFDIFAIWTLALTAIGFSCVSKAKRGTALAIVFGWYVLLSLVFVGIAAAFS
ncbi:MAG TPA: YIP1 family protein [Candidatus Acidoferrales bacterium]|nr:YIP1 family protein [Candidatus Acidoferrales bacterium]